MVYKVKLHTDEDKLDIKSNPEDAENQRKIELKMIEISKLIQEGSQTFLR